jgi:putative membrane protein
VVHVFARAIRENFDTRFMRIALIAFLIVPSLYAGLYLWSNIDPYANMKNLPVALVSEDEGAMIGGVEKNLGEDVVAELVSGGELHFIVTDTQDAKRGINSEDYYFAIVIPSDFSRSIASINDAILVSGQWEEPTPAKVSLMTNDANNFLAHQVAEQAGESLQANLKQQVSNQLTVSLLEGLKDVHDNLVEASSGAQQIADALATLNASTDMYDEGIAKLSGAVDQLEDGVSRLSQGASQVASGNAQLDDYAQMVRNLEGLAFSNWTYQLLPELTAQIENIPIDAGLRADLLNTLHTLAGDIQSFHSQVDSGLDDIDALSTGSNELSAGLKQLLSTLPALKDGVTQLQSGFAKFEDATQKVEQGADQLTSGLKEGYQKIPALDVTHQNLIAKVVADPLQIEDHTSARASGYAAGLLPFFLALSAWIGAYTIFVLLKPFAKNTLRLKKNATSTTLGNYLVPLSIGIGQMLLLFGVVTGLLRLPPVHVGWSLLFMMLTTATYTMIIFTLVGVLKKVGLFLGLVLLVLQLTAAGGTFPWQTTPEFFQVVHHIFPMGYAVDAFRQTFYGGNLSIAGKDALFLCAWWLAFFLIACIYARVKLRRER